MNERDRPDGQMSAVEIQELPLEELPAAVRLLARAMRENPLHIAAFGADPQRRERRLAALFGAYLPAMRRLPLAAYQDGVLVGILGLAMPHACRPPARKGLRVLGAVCHSGPLVAARAARWFSVYEWRDPREPHWHLGPVAVKPALQGRGIGSRLLAAFCALVDAERGAAYLETDRAGNHAFYRRFGFEPRAEARILGTRNWFMRRPPLGAR